MSNVAYVTGIQIAFQEESLPYLSVEWYAVQVDQGNAVTAPDPSGTYREQDRTQVPFTPGVALAQGDVRAAVASDVRLAFADDSLDVIFLS